MTRWSKDKPFDRESRYSRLLREDVSSNAVNDGLCRRIIVQLFRVVLIVNVVAHAYKLSAIVGASQKNDGDTQDLGRWQVVQIRGIGFENEFVDADGNRSN